MTQQTINIGSAPNDGTGDKLRTSGQKINENFTEVYTTSQSAFDKANTARSTLDGTYLNLASNTGVQLQYDPTGELLDYQIANGSWLYVDSTGMVFQSNTTGTYNSYTFGNDGTIFLPGNTGRIICEPNTITIYSDAGELNGMLMYSTGTEIYGIEDVSIFTDNAGAGKTFRFKANGSILFPYGNGNARTGSGDKFSFEKNFNQKIISTQNGTIDQPTVERLVVSGGDAYFDNDTSSYTSGEAGDIYLWAGRGFNGGDIKIDAGQSYGSGQEGGTIKIRAGNSNAGYGGFVEIRSGTGDGTQDSGAPVYLYSNNHQWIFTEYGGLQFPDSSTQTTAVSPYKPTTSTSSPGNVFMSLTDEVIFCDTNAAGADINVVLPNPTVLGKVITVKNINAGANVVYVQPGDPGHAMELLNGSVGTGLYETLPTSGNTVTWLWDSGCWRIISSY